jgi:hypothetical protein
VTSRFANFIAGEWVAPSTGTYVENRNPADPADLIGEFPASGAEDLAGRRLEVQIPGTDAMISAGFLFRPAAITLYSGARGHGPTKSETARSEGETTHGFRTS